VKIHPDELALARAFDSAAAFEGLTEAQNHAIMTRGRDLFHWFKAHKPIHYVISTAVLVGILGTDVWVQTGLPSWLLPAGTASAWTPLILTAVLAGALHSWLLYSIAVYSMHEGAAHKLVYPPEGPVSRFFHFVSIQFCRLTASEPDFYSRHHMAHHAKFGTEDDGEFLNFVRFRRYGLTFLPYATEINYSDFIIHRPLEITLRRFASGLISMAYNGAFAWYAYRHFGAAYAVVAYLVMMPHFGFLLDRVRQYTEHNLMPLDNRNGSRSFGFGFWGLLVGGGPWGSPCHWEHHLVPSLPWYQQLILHRTVVRLLTPQQRRQFLIEPVIGFPRLWWRLITRSRQFANS
jgi:hypothetical protein